MGLKFAGGEFQTRLVLDLLLAWTFGILFQYLTIVPKRGLSFGQGPLQAIRVDTFAIIAFEIGLFTWMALTHYVLVPGEHLKPTQAAFRFMTQIGMILGFFTSYPANVFLLKIGWKEKMLQYKYETNAENVRGAVSGERTRSPSFLRSKIRGAVRTPETAEALLRRHFPMAKKRLCLGTGCYETFTRDNVTPGDIRIAPKEEITPTGLRRKNAEYKLESIVFATGFDTMSGGPAQVEIRGRGRVPSTEIVIRPRS
jgi:Domain of unknown function (DUF4396)